MTQLVLAWVLCLAVVPTAAAQTQPDFSGTWAMDESRSGSVTQGTFVGPVQWVIQQSPEGVILQRRRGDTELHFTYAWSDQETSASVVAPTLSGPGHRASWAADRLVLETHQNIQGKTVTTKEVLTLFGGGRELLVERVLEVEHGYTLRGAQNYSAVKDTFTKLPR